MGAELWNFVEMRFDVLFPDENNALKCSCSYFTYLDNDREYNIKRKNI